MSRPRVFLDVNVGEEPAGRLTVELFADRTPRTCENFRQLCTGEHDGLSYAKSPFHRVIDEFMVQGGDIKNGDGTGVTSIYGNEFEDENIHWRSLDAAGLVCAANRGPDTNGSQFFITLEPCEHLNGKHTVFGRLVSGEDTLEKVSKVRVDDNDRPLQPVLVSRCGELEKKNKTRQPARQDTAVSDSRDRGRPRRSDAADMDVTPPRHAPRNRRQSDNIIDEGLRGRPRARSRSNSQALDETDEASGTDSPVSKHKRKRSPVPSRHVTHNSTDESESAHERRRRSLPNQYAKERIERVRGDEERYRPSPRQDGREYAGVRREEGDWRRRGDSYRPRQRGADDGRLGGEGRLGGGGEGDAGVKYKGRGSMKYREPGRL